LDQELLCSGAWVRGSRLFSGFLLSLFSGFLLSRGEARSSEERRGSKLRGEALEEREAQSFLRRGEARSSCRPCSLGDSSLPLLCLFSALLLSLFSGSCSKRFSASQELVLYYALYFQELRLYYCFTFLLCLSSSFLSNRERDRQTDRERERETDRQTDRQTGKTEGGREGERERGRERGRASARLAAADTPTAYVYV
jgi:hypothetical protein